MRKEEIEKIMKAKNLNVFNIVEALDRLQQAINHNVDIRNPFADFKEVLIRTLRDDAAITAAILNNLEEK